MSIRQLTLLYKSYNYLKVRGSYYFLVRRPAGFIPLVLCHEFGSSTADYLRRTRSVPVQNPETLVKLIASQGF